MKHPGIDIIAKLGVNEDSLRAFCRKWDVIEVDLFGSALGPDFRPDSDVDLLVVYGSGAHRTLLDEVTMQQELDLLFGRPVHFMTRDAVNQSPNQMRRSAILQNATPLYVESA